MNWKCASVATTDVAWRSGLVRMHAWLTALEGWRRCLAATVLGALAALALPPWYVVVLLVPAFAGLVWLVEVVPRGRTAFLVGWCFGFGHFLVGVHWVGSALLVDPLRHGWLLPFAVGGLAAGLGLFPATSVLAYRWLAHRGAVSGAGRVIAFAGIWTAGEWVRGWIFTGFPWNLIGYSWAGSTAVLQIASVIGIYGLSLLTMIAATMPAVLVPVPTTVPGTVPGTARAPRRAVLAVALATLLLPALLWAGGTARLAAAPGLGTDQVPDVRLRLVQANIPQRLKWQPDLRRGHLQRHVAMSRQAGAPPPTHLVWPETAVPFFLSVDAPAREAVAAAIPLDGVLLTGAPRTEPAAAPGGRFWNSVHAIDGAGDIVATYDKAHLVPFGEYVPARGILPIDKIVTGTGDFTRGPGRRTLRIDGLPPVSALVCYEVIFPGAVVDRRDRPHWILNLTNDAWFGNSAGPRQHLAIARVRTVEEGLPLVRAASTGISAVIDPYGRTVAQLGVGEAGLVDSGLPRPTGLTPFARLGNRVLAVLALAIVALTLALRQRGREAVHPGGKA